ncbi:hypothetical protein GGR52DRAFT_583120 [Hypoxylon sp. FL1284]|nr:hypothetical protein GGR52DRAFT_583120 [Hypoxylon sp. FL1284]
MSKILAVFGATGQQGSSVVNFVLNDAELSQKYRIRIITRDANSEKAKQLQGKVEVAQGDVLGRASLEKALTGVHTIFAMTTPGIGPDGLEVEYSSGKRIADVAVEKGAEYIIFSTLPSPKELSGGKYPNVTPFEGKAMVESYIRGLPIKSAFYSPGYFMENFQRRPSTACAGPPTAPTPMRYHVSAGTQLPVVNAREDTGKFVGAILADPDRYEGRASFCAAAALYTLGDLAAIISKAAGKKIVLERISPEEFAERMPGPLGTIFAEAFQYQEEFGLYGPDGENLVAWAVENARGKICTLRRAEPLYGDLQDVPTASRALGEDKDD